MHYNRWRRTGNAEGVVGLEREGSRNAALTAKARAAGWLTPGERKAADPWAHLDTASRAEIEELYLQQKKDARTLQAQYGPSLDQVINGLEEDGGKPLYGIVHFDRPDDAWPYFAALGLTRNGLARTSSR